MTILIGVSVVAPLQAQQRSFTPDELIKVRTIVDVQQSPNGDQILYVLATADREHGTYRSAIWRVGVGGGQPLQLTAEGRSEESPRWSPDGHSIAVLSDRDEVPQVWIRSAAGGDAQVLTSAPTGVRSFEWSPDARQIAFIATDPPNERADQRDQGRDAPRVVDEHFEQSHLHIIEVATRLERQLTRGAFSVADISWSADGRHIAFTHRPTPRTLDDYKTDVYVVTVANGAMRALVQRPGRDDTPKWSPDGSRIAFESTDGSTAEFASVHLFVVPAAGGKPVDVTKSVGERIYDFYGWSADSKRLFFRVRQGVTTQVFAATVANGAVLAVSKGLRAFDLFSIAKDAHGRMAFAASDPKTPRNLYTSPIDSFEPEEILAPNPELVQFRFGETRIVHWKSRDGTQLEGLLSLPVGYEAGRRYPLLTVVHGGPSGAFCIGFGPQASTENVPLSMEPYPPQLFAEQGYVTFMPNIRGSGGYGEQFRKANIRDWGGEDFVDMTTGIDELIREGIADPDRVGILGWSYGGFMAARAITQTDRFKAAEVGGGLTDLISLYGTTSQPDQLEAYFGGPPWGQPELYQSRSAVLGAAKMSTPTLIQHGEQDADVPVGQAYELYRALIARGVSTELVVYPRSGHIVTDPNLNLDVWRRILEWFNAWLSPSAQRE